MEGLTDGQRTAISLSTSAMGLPAVQIWTIWEYSCRVVGLCRDATISMSWCGGRSEYQKAEGWAQEANGSGSILLCRRSVSPRDRRETALSLRVITRILEDSHGTRSPTCD